MGLRASSSVTRQGEPDPSAGAEPWARLPAFESLLELNEQSLELFAALADDRSATPTVRQIGELCARLDAPARTRAAACPYLLVDAGFGDLARWRRVLHDEIADGDPLAYGHPLPGPAVARLAVRVLTYAWHLVRSEGPAARLILGMPVACASVLAQLSLHRVHDLAERHPEWLQPRWAARTAIWCELLTAASSGRSALLDDARMHGWQLLAAEARASA